MALLTQTIKDGKVVDTESAAQKKKNDPAYQKNNGLDKEAFLQLLVAQMQYQDPLEPMDNTEYISQLATFSQLEATQNLADTVTNSFGNSLVGKYVILNTDSGSVHGKVDYVMYDNGDILLAVNDGLYNMEDLDSVADSTYYEAFEMANLFSSMLAVLPDAKNFTSGNVEAFGKLKAVLEAMDVYQQSFISEDDLEKYKELLEVYERLTASPSEDTNSNTNSSDKTDDKTNTDSETGKVPDDLKDA